MSYLTMECLEAFEISKVTTSQAESATWKPHIYIWLAHSTTFISYLAYGLVAIMVTA